VIPASAAHRSHGAGPLRAGEPHPLPRIVDDIDLLRAEQYDLLAILLGQAPGQALLASLATLDRDETPLGLARGALAEVARRADPGAVSREFFDLFVGLGRGEFLPYASYYLSGFLHERPLARVRADLADLAIERAGAQREPEDHIAILCEVMAGLSSGRFEADVAWQRAFFERHLKPWAARFFADLERAESARFYRAVGGLGRAFMEIEAEAFLLDA
jgi:TorA maturation chaperone TorD